MKKIVIINQYGITPDLPGATKHYDMSKYFASKKTHDVEFWMCGYNHHTGKNHNDLKGIKLQSSFYEDNLKLVRIKSTPYRRSSLLRQINHTVFDLITALKILFSREIDAIVLSIPPISNFNIWAIKLRKIRLITDVEDLWPLFLVDMGLKNKLAITYMEKCSNYTYNTSDAIAPVSNGMINYVKGLLKKTCEMWLAPLGVNLDLYDNIKKEVDLIKDKVWKDDFKIMYLGAHGRANNLYPVLKMVKSINSKLQTYGERRISFIFIGDGDDKKNLVEFARKEKIENVHFEDAVPGNMVPSYLVHADVCLTNLKKVESFKLVRPNKLFQYMALSKPIICGIWGESKEIVVDEAKSGIYVDFDDIENAANEVIEMIKNPIKLKEYGKNGRLYIEKYGDRRKIFDDYYKHVLNIIQK
ncbi:glycosyltransferase family 4 protein [Schinkia sp. CFF1]